MTNKENTISANELRIGNLVKCISKNETSTIEFTAKITGILSDFVYVSNKDNEKGIKVPLINIEPVLLSEEILLKIEGIEKDNEWYSLTNLHYNSLTKRFYIGNDHVSSGHDDAYIEYLHQLQNLYFALTNEELKITL